MNDHHLNLLQAEIDGLNTEADSQTVQNLIASDSELKVAYEELQAVKLAMASLVEIEPPPTLRESIMNAIPDHTPSQERAPETAGSFWSGIVDMIRAPRPVSLAYAFSLGLIVAFVVSTVLFPPVPTDSIDQVSGTMAFTDTSGYETIAEYAIEDEDEEGNVRVAKKDRDIIIEIVWRGESTIEATILFSDEYFGVRGSWSDVYATTVRTTTRPGGVTVEGEGPMDSFIALGPRSREVPEDEEELAIEVRSGGRSLLSRSLWFKR